MSPSSSSASSSSYSPSAYSSYASCEQPQKLIQSNNVDFIFQICYSEYISTWRFKLVLLVFKLYTVFFDVSCLHANRILSSTTVSSIESTSSKKQKRSFRVRQASRRKSSNRTTKVGICAATVPIMNSWFSAIRFAIASTHSSHHSGKSLSNFSTVVLL